MNARRTPLLFALVLALAGCALHRTPELSSDPEATGSYREACDRACQAVIIASLEATQRAHPDAWQKGPASSRDLTFVNLAVRELRARGIVAGLNGKRGTDVISHDVIVLPNPSGCPDTSGTYAGLSIIDFVVGSETPSAHITFGDASADTNGVCYTSGKFIEPTGGSVVIPPILPPVCPPLVCPAKAGYPGDAVGGRMGSTLEADYREAGQALDSGAAIWIFRTLYDFLFGGLTIEESIAKHRGEWRAVLGLP